MMNQENFYDTKDVVLEMPILPNMENYGPYEELLTKRYQTIEVSTLTKENWGTHFYSILNILKDGIELDEIQSSFINLVFKDGFSVELSIMDYWINLMVWNSTLNLDMEISPKHIIFDKEFKASTLKKYIDKYVIEANRIKVSPIKLNQIIDDMMRLFSYIDNFSMYLSNTMNLEDFIGMMNKSQEVYDILHVDLSGSSIEDTKSDGMNYTNRFIEIMKNDSKKLLGYDHCLSPAWRASEGVNPKQFKEFSVSIGSKPDGQGGVFPIIINNSFIAGGLTDPVYYFIESSAGRIAQILSKMNTGTSGKFARILGLNNASSFLHKDPTYICNTKNFIKCTITDATFLKKLNNRYYRLDPNGMEYILKASRDSRLIGRTIYLKSPMTCASHARGEGICYRCYGDLAYTNNQINIGRMASENLTSVLTQMLLSAKHLLETRIDKTEWCKEFNEFFEIDGNVISVAQDISLKNFKLLIDPDDIELENEDEEDLSDSGEDSIEYSSQYNEYITGFEVVNVETGETINISSANLEKLYISDELNNIIRHKAKPEEGKVALEMSDLKGIFLFLIHIQNNDLTKSLNQISKLLNNSKSIENLDKDSWFQSLMETVIKGNIDTLAVHLEVIMSNQIRDTENELNMPDWEKANADYKLVSLDNALTNNPSVTVSLSYQKISKMLYNPLVFKKNGASFMDLFFMTQPQFATQNVDPVEEKSTVNEYFDSIAKTSNKDNNDETDEVDEE